MQDSLGRNINYLRVSVTDLCNLRCQYCMPQEGVTKRSHNDILSFEEIQEIVQVFADLGISKVRVTGGEPLARRDLPQLLADIKKIPEISELALTTNGILLPKMALSLKQAGLDRVNISLDTLNPARYATITRGGELAKTLEGIAAAKEAGLLPIKINTVVIGGFNDDEIGQFAELTRHEPIEVRFIELMPIGSAAHWAKERFVSNESIKKNIPNLEKVENGVQASPATYYRLPNSKGKIGFINPISSHFCGSCNRIRLTADGKIKPCLHSNEEIDVRKTGDKQELREMLKQCIVGKPDGHKLNDSGTKPIVRDMVRIGG